MKTFMVGLIIMSMALFFGCFNEAENIDSPNAVISVELDNVIEPVTESGPDAETGETDEGEQGEQDNADEPEPWGKYELGFYADWGLDIETERQIVEYWWYNSYALEEYLRRGYILGDLFHVCGYYGTYNGYFIIKPITSTMGRMWGVSFEGVSLDLTWPGLTAWKDGRFYSLHELLQQGLLTREDLISIYEFEAPVRSGARRVQIRID